MEVATGVFLGPIFEMLRDKFVSLLVPNYARSEGIDSQLKKLEKMLPHIRVVLADAEEKQMTDDRVKSWLEDLADLAYDLDDLLDDFATETLRLDEQASTTPSKVRKLIPTCFTRFTTPPSAVKFDQNMMSKVEEITTRLQDIQTRKNCLDLKENIRWIRSNKIRERRETTSLVDKSQVYGRENDKEAILELLLRDEASVDKVSVIPIVGMGGIGKTTLARLVYDDELLEGRFDLKAWVCVSDDYDAVRVTKMILEAVTSKPHDFQALNMLQVELRKNFSEKRFLLVLDDIWNENYADWELLQRPFMFGAPGSKIVVTTRLGNVASTMSLSPGYPLKELLKDECLSLFAHHALGKRNFDAHPTLKGIAEKIVSKCKGLPLAVITLAGLLRTKRHQNEWVDVLNSEIWDLPEQKSDILPALRLSYHHLPSHLKQCFAYCAIFPKDYEFDKDELVLLWMGVGLLQLSKEKKRTEDFGDECFDDLLSRSFFQQSGRSKSQFVMHDLLNDLALHVAGKICFRLDNLEGDKQFEIPKRARHLSYIRQQFEVLQKFTPLCKVQHLRTVLALPVQIYDWKGCYLANKVLFYLLPELQCLRVLSLSGYSITELPDSIGDLKHLRYLNLSRTLIRRLPESVTTLYNLQTLLLCNCKNLCMLPSNIGNLINLRHLDITGNEQLIETCSGIGRLTNLQALSKFVVGKNNGPGLKELRNLRLLRGSISIIELQNVSDVRDANGANLRAKEDLEELELAWCSEFNDFRNENLEMNVLDMLKPHTDLKKFTIEFYGGTNFPSWLGDPSFSKMVNLTLVGCRKCRCLPALGQLPMLKELHIQGMDEVQNFGVEFYGDHIPLGLPFPSLETLIFEDMPAWEEWSCSIGVKEAERQFPCLRELTIRCCPKLIRVSVLKLPSLRTLYLEECDKVVLKSIIDVISLTSLDVVNITGLSQLDEALLQSLVALESLGLRECNQLVALWQNGGGVTQKNHLVRLQRLSVSSCPQLVSFGEEFDDEGLPCINLERLYIEDCVNLEKLPNELNNLTSLTCLRIDGCSKLGGFPKTGVPPTLRELWIRNCNELKFLPDGISGLEELHIQSCSSLRFWATDMLPTALKIVRIHDCMNLEYLWKVSETSMMLHQQQQNINILLLHIDNWPKVGMLLHGGVGYNLASLRELRITKCDVVESLSFPERGLPNLTSLGVSYCKNLRSLVTTNLILQSLESLRITDCESLESIPERGGCLSTPNLRSLHITNCSNLESLSFPERGGCLSTPNLRSIAVYSCRNLRSLATTNQILQSLEYIEIYDCESLESLSILERGGCLSTPNLRSLDVYKCMNFRSLATTNKILQSLESLRILECPGLEYIPERGGCLFTPNLRSLYIWNCSNLRWLPFFDQILQRLESISIVDCPCLESFPQGKGNFSPNLIDLRIGNCGNVFKPLSKWGLHRLTSLRRFTIKGGYPELVSFPFPEEEDDDKYCLLPATLTSLWIEDLPNLDSISSKGGGLQNLTSLQDLIIQKCPKLQSLPKEFPSTLQILQLMECPLLEERCLEDAGEYWPNIAHIPCVTTVPMPFA